MNTPRACHWLGTNCALPASRAKVHHAMPRVATVTATDPDVRQSRTDRTQLIAAFSSLFLHINTQDSSDCK